MHDSAYRDAERFISRYLKTTPLEIAEIGSYDANGTIRHLLDEPGWKYVGWDIVQGPNVDRLLGGLYEWPFFADASVDVVVTTQVLEHVPMPWRWMESIARVVRPGGLVYVCAPNTAHYHEHPVDCWRVWPDGMHAVMTYAGLDVLECYATPYQIAGREYGDTTGIAVKR